MVGGLQTKTGDEVNYASIGSGGGIKQIESDVVAFGASDMPFTPDDLLRQQRSPVPNYA